ncbi:hypothetical protein [Sphingomonas sp.]|uniref:hypothetical protein n=1 Tax=Sphingomonas sp. TaxID=28214 RepID=UPI0028B1DDA3|nr:hypothetical protein [Sphingomonas sp.]
MTDLDQRIEKHRREHDHLAGRQLNPWGKEHRRLYLAIEAATSIEERDLAQKALRDHYDTRFSPTMSANLLAEQTRRNAIADGQR